MLVGLVGQSRNPGRAARGWSAGRLRSYHRDPFDRILIALARHEQLVVVTDDEVFARYDVAVHGR